MAAAASASVINPLTSSLSNSKSELFADSSRALKQAWVGPATSLRLRNKNCASRRLSSGCSVVCKAVSVKPPTEIEGLNIAEDVTQVGHNPFSSSSSSSSSF